MFPAVKKSPKSNSNDIRPEDAERGAKFKAAREAAGLTQPQLAELAGWAEKDSDAGQKRVSAYETGRRSLGLEEALVYADALGRDIYDILGFKRRIVQPKKKS